MAFKRVQYGQIDTVKEAMKKVPLALTRIGIHNEETKRFAENYIVNLIYTTVRTDKKFLQENCGCLWCRFKSKFL